MGKILLSVFICMALSGASAFGEEIFVEDLVPANELMEELALEGGLAEEGEFEALRRGGRYRPRPPHRPPRHPRRPRRPPPPRRPPVYICLAGDYYGYIYEGRDIRPDWAQHHAMNYCWNVSFGCRPLGCR